MKKSLALTLAILMVIGIAIGGTIAWLTDTSEEVKNTFTTSDVEIELHETGTDTEGKKSYQMIPGYTLEKDPYVTVSEDSENCYLFVEVNKSENFDTYLTCAIKEGWTELTGVSGVSGVYWKLIDEATEKGENGKHFVLDNNQVTVKDSVTKEKMNELTEDTYPTLTFKAYACQYMKNNTQNFTPAEAWGKIADE